MRGNPEVSTDSSVNLMSEQAGLSLSGCVTRKPDKCRPAIRLVRTTNSLLKNPIFLVLGSEIQVIAAL
jgi:hypothetical protein